MPKRILDDFLLRQNNYSNESLTSFPVGAALLCVMTAGILRAGRAAEMVVPWWWIPILLGCALILLIGSYYFLRYVGFILSIRLKQEGVYLSRGVGRYELEPWAQVKEVRGSGLSRDVLLDGLNVLFIDGSKCPLEYPPLEDQQHRWLRETARTIPDSVPIFPRDHPLARAREAVQSGEGTAAPASAWILRLFLRGEAPLSLAWMMIVPVLLFAAFSMKWGSSILVPILGGIALAFPILSASLAIHALSGARYRTLLFFGASRVARIAPEGTRVLKAPYAGFRAWRPALLGRQGEVLPLTICGLGPGREQLLRLADQLPEDDPARVDIERYLSIAAVWQPRYVQATLVFSAGMYAVAIGIFCEAGWMSAAGAVVCGLGGWLYALRFQAIYAIGRGVA